MPTPRELSKEMAALCRQSAEKPKHKVAKSTLGQAILQGVMVALLAVSGDTGESPDRSNPWDH